MDFGHELLARLEAAQLNSPPQANAALASEAAAAAALAAGAGGENGGAAARRSLWPGDYACGSASPGSSGRQTPRSSAGLLEALITSDGSPQA